jgi:TatD DNase family protein
VIDFHCHLDLYPDPVAVVAECRTRNMYVLSVTTTPAAWAGTYALAAGSSRIRTALGLHPQLVAQRKSELPLLLSLISDTRYIGEIGLDGSRDFAGSLGDQIDVFDAVLQGCADAGGRILSIHSKGAAKMVLDALSQRPAAGTPILHWFSGTERELLHAIDLGCWFSIGPAMLKSQKGLRLVERMPRDRILTESDGPFASVQGRSALPWDVGEAEGSLAKVWALSNEATQQALLANLRRLAVQASRLP